MKTVNFQNSELIKGIIFDLDGTLIKSVVDFPKMKRRMIEFVKKLPFDNPNYSIEQTTNEIILDLNQKMDQNKLPENKKKKILNDISQILTEVEFENIHKVQLLPGVREFMENFTRQNIKMGILTRASEKYTNSTLQITNIKDFFTVVATRDDFTLLRAKPHLDALQYTIKKLSTPPENVLFVGDHVIDYTCATRGDIRFVGVLEGAYNRKMLNGLSDVLTVKDFFELAHFVTEINNNSNKR